MALLAWYLAGVIDS